MCFFDVALLSAEAAGNNGETIFCCCFCVKRSAYLSISSILPRGVLDSAVRCLHQVMLQNQVIFQCGVTFCDHSSTLNQI